MYGIMSLYKGIHSAVSNSSAELPYYHVVIRQYLSPNSAGSANYSLPKKSALCGESLYVLLTCFSSK